MCSSVETLGSVILEYRSLKSIERLLVVAYDVESKLHFKSCAHRTFFSVRLVIPLLLGTVIRTVPTPVIFYILSSGNCIVEGMKFSK